MRVPRLFIVLRNICLHIKPLACVDETVVEVPFFINQVHERTTAV